MVWPLAALFAIFCAALLALGRQARGYGLWLLAGAVLGAAFSWQTAARFAVWTERYDGELVDLTACVEDLRPGYTQDTVRARLRVQTANGEAADFCCWCDDLPLCQAGDRITGRFLLEAPSMDSRADRYADGAAFDAYYKRRFETAGPAPGFRAWSARLQTRLSDALCRELEGDEAGALAAMIVGDRTRISQELNDDYRAAGLSHVLVVSGMHVTLLCGFLKPGLLEKRRWLDRGQKLAIFLPGRSGSRVYRRLGLCLAREEQAAPRPAVGGWHAGILWRQRLAALWPVCLAVLLCGITGFTPSVLRAVAAVVIGALGVWLLAPSDPLTSLAAAGLVMSAFNSYAVCDVGFQLSFAAVAGTLAGAALARDILPPQDPLPYGNGAAAFLGRLGRSFWEAGCISVCASAATFPVLVLRGLSASPYALVSGVLILWLVEPLMVLGIAAALLGLWAGLQPLYHLCAWGAGVLVRILNGWARMAAAWPRAELSFDTHYAAVVCLVLMGLCLLAHRWKIRPVHCLYAVVLVGAVSLSASSWLSQGVVEVVAVGSGPSAVLVQDGRAVVLYQGGQAAVEQALERRGIRQADWLVDLRTQPGYRDRPDAARTVTVQGLGESWELRDYRIACGDIQVEMVHLKTGNAARVTVGPWQIGAATQGVWLGRPQPVDWLLAGRTESAAFDAQGVLAASAYDWMEQPPARILRLRPEGGARAIP